MFYNEVNAVLGVSNWSDSVMRLNDSDSDSDSESTDNMHPETRDGKVVQVRKKSIPEICVILSGPFTPTQKAKVFKKTKIDWSHVKNALLWLKTYNRLYADVDAETYINVTPRIVDESESVASGNNNIEDVYEVFAVFPDNNVPHHTTGGCENSGELKELTIKHLLSKENCKEVSLISRPTRNILRDYQGDNLLLAFPVLFPYGLGSRDANDEPRLGTGYLRHLCCLSERNFHQATWVCILYNMLERQRLIRASYLKTREEKREMFCQISCNDIAGAMARCSKALGEEHTTADGRTEGIVGFRIGRRGVFSWFKKGMIGAALMATKVHKVAAPMASYLIRNGSRFHFSHNFSYVDIGSFFKAIQEDLNISADEDGSVFLKSSVSNYLCRPKELEEVCVYDFESQYVACKPVTGSLEWAVPHPNNDHLKVRQLSMERIPVISYLDFVNTKEFDGNDIFCCKTEEIPPEKLSSMEQHAKACCVLFVPFWNVADLKLNGCYLERWRKVYQDGKLSKKHEQFLMNIQDCRNSMNGGRPVDMIERLTVKPVISRYNDGYDVEEEDGDDILNEAMDQFFLSESLELGYDNEFRDSRGRFQCQSILTRCHGSHRCGKNLVVCPNVQSSERFIVVEATETKPSETNETDFSTCNRHMNVKALNELALKVVTTRVVDKNGRAIDMGVNGTLENVPIRESECLQDYSHKESKRRRRDGIRRQIGKVINNKQLIGFLSGAGGTGKSLVIKTVSRYAQKLCKALHVMFDKRSIVVTALTGAAAVSINGETTAKAFAFKREVRNELEEFKHAYLVTVDEISFASVEDVDVLNQKMKQILDNTMAPFGGVPVVFSGDFTQLLPVGGIPLYRRDEGAEWRQSINVFMELKTNHRFGKDLVWGKLLGRFRDHGPTTDEVATINARVVGACNGPLEKNVPSDAVYATKTNVDRMAINDAIFVKHLEKTHFTDPNRQPPMHTLCIKAGNPRFHLTGTRKEYRVMENKAQDVMYAAVGEAPVSDKCKKYHDPLLKLYLGRPLCINQNGDVSSCIANGAMCEFRGMKLKPGASMDQFETIVIVGYYVNCVSVTQVESLLLKMLDGNAGEEGEHIIELNPKTIYALARFPVPCLGPITKKSMRTSRRISFDQFPINCANARTVQKLQGRSIKNLVVSAWDYTGNWIYVCLSRCTTLHGLFLREPLNPNKTKGMSEEVKAFMKSMREIQQYDRVHLHREDL
ncbi:PIF1-like helicase [Nitzschia inconspicua]|uniref:ATP-dependent DNA helicase n=2 Tax=Nitzschia inconspicua TaxID=303405 RepID=A0A9K3L0F8_9STRA|nr:PIF1-like helicase [Nitzschia inconspicua]